MIRKIAEYTVREDELDVVLPAIAEFVQAIAQSEPGTVYEAYQRQGRPAFLHFMAFLDVHAEQQHQQAPYTRRFVEVLYPRCTIQPTFTDLDPIE